MASFLQKGAVSQLQPSCHLPTTVCGVKAGGLSSLYLLGRFSHDLDILWCSFISLLHPLSSVLGSNCFQFRAVHGLYPKHTSLMQEPLKLGPGCAYVRSRGALCHTLARFPPLPDKLTMSPWVCGWQNMLLQEELRQSPQVMNMSLEV